MSIYQCPECGFQYDERVGDQHEGIKPGTLWSALPQDTACPNCAVRFRDDFELLQTPSSSTNQSK